MKKLSSNETLRRFIYLPPAMLLPDFVFAGTEIQLQNFTTHWASLLAVGIFVVFYLFVIAEEALHLRKSKPIMVAAGFIWVIVALVYSSHGDTHSRTGSQA